MSKYACAPSVIWWYTVKLPLTGVMRSTTTSVSVTPCAGQSVAGTTVVPVRMNAAQTAICRTIEREVMQCSP